MARPRRRPRRPPPIRDPLLPIRPRILNQQARAAAMAQINPIVAELTRSINQRAAAGAANIEGVSTRLAQSLQGAEGRVAGIYGQSQQQLGAVNQQVTQQVQQAAQQGGEALAARLRQAGIDSGQAQQLAAEGAGATATTGAFGGNALAQLIQGGAAARGFAATLPGLAQLSGLQGVREMQARRQQELAEGLGEIRSRVPGLVSDLTERGREREVNKAIALRTFGLDVAKLEQEARESQQTLAQRNRQARLDRRAKARESALGRRATAQEGAKERAHDARQSQLEYERDRGAAREEFDRSLKKEADRRRFERKERQARERFQARESKRNRKSYGSKKKKSESASGLGP